MKLVLLSEDDRYWMSLAEKAVSLVKKVTDVYWPRVYQIVEESGWWDRPTPEGPLYNYGSEEQLIYHNPDIGPVLNSLYEKIRQYPNERRRIKGEVAKERPEHQPLIGRYLIGELLVKTGLSIFYMIEDAFEQASQTDSQLREPFRMINSAIYELRHALEIAEKIHFPEFSRNF